MKTMTFGRKLALGFGVVVLLSAMMVTVSVVTLSRVIESEEQLLEVTMENLLDAERVRSAALTKIASARGYLLTEDTRFLQDMEATRKTFTDTFAAFERRSLTRQEAELVARLDRAQKAYRAALHEVVELRRGAAPLDTVLASFEREVVPPAGELEDAVTAFVHFERARRDERIAGVSRAASTGQILVLVMGGVLVALAAIIAFVLTRTLTRQIGDAVQNVRSSSAELTTTAAQQASGAKEQAVAMSQVTSTVAELLASSRQIAEGAQQVARLSREAEEAARSGVDTVQGARDSVSSIRAQVDVIVEHMVDLGKRSQRTGVIVDIINELAEQTNILAINATIEAAGAGEAGRRFAAVGEEIRKLADRVSGSTKEIRELIEQIRSAINATIMATESGAKRADEGTQRFDELATSFGRIGTIVTDTTEAAREIELSTKQQTTAVEQVDVAVGNVAQATREAEVGATQTAQTASQMLSVSSALARLVTRAQA